MKKFLNKVIYFDKETINNLLEQFNEGSREVVSGTSSNSKVNGEISAEGSIKLKIPFLQRFGFLFSSKIATSYIREKAKSVTVTSTEISEFETLKQSLECIENVQIKDIENSSTFFRVAGGYLKFLKGDVDDVDVKEFGTVMDSYDGYDTYKIDNNRYIRFNNDAFVSNYKRNDLLTTKMTVYCIPVGNFDHKEFDFFEQISKMETMITGIERTMTLSDLYPPKKEIPVEHNLDSGVDNKEKPADKIPLESKIKLFDGLYASISQEKS
ncbi:DUF6414 family protein [Lactococcus lactis]|uniref:DUF6414 family protein n=1 Tax=Lactococcus lactis TaxID=1358 RepID=UPI001F58745E|nr:DUF6414 family protein [Lactococcus lactis]